MDTTFCSVFIEQFSQLFLAKALFGARYARAGQSCIFFQIFSLPLMENAVVRTVGKKYLMHKNMTSRLHSIRLLFLFGWKPPTLATFICWTNNATRKAHAIKNRKRGSSRAGLEPGQAMHYEICCKKPGSTLLESTALLFLNQHWNPNTFQIRIWVNPKISCEEKEGKTTTFPALIAALVQERPTWLA